MHHRDVDSSVNRPTERRFGGNNQEQVICRFIKSLHEILGIESFDGAEVGAPCGLYSSPRRYWNPAAPCVVAADHTHERQQLEELRVILRRVRDTI